MRGNHTRTHIPIQKRSARRVTRHVLCKAQRRQRSTDPMIIHTQLNTARRQIQPFSPHAQPTSAARVDTNTQRTICYTLKPKRHSTTSTNICAGVTQAAIAPLNHL